MAKEDYPSTGEAKFNLAEQPKHEGRAGVVIQRHGKHKGASTYDNRPRRYWQEPKLGGEPKAPKEPDYVNTVLKGFAISGFSLIMIFILLQIFIVYANYEPGSMFDMRTYVHDMLSAFSGFKWSDWALDSFSDVTETWHELASVFVIGSDNFLDIFHGIANIFMLLYNVVKVVVAVIGNGFMVVGHIFKVLFTFTGEHNYWIPNKFNDFYDIPWSVPEIPPLIL